MPTQDTLNEVIAAAFPGGTLIRHKPLEGGVSADVTMIEVRDATGDLRKSVLREHGARHCGHPAKLEFALLSALYALALPVARPMAFCSGSSGEGAANRLPWVLIEYVEGTTPVPAEKADARIDAMADQLFAFHTAPTATLPALPLRIDPQPELFDFLPTTPEWNRFRERLTQIGPQPFSGQPALLHGDYWPANIIFQNDAIKAVIDWEDAALGDPLSDVACAQLELRYIYGPWGAQRFAQGYAGHRALDRDRLALWQAYVAASGVKSMGGWGLEPAREALMRGVALQFLREAVNALVI